LTPEKIIIITAPSGSGKTTLVKRLLVACPQLAFSISACTRLPRSGEVHGKDYYFYTEEQFKKLIDENAFIEWEMVYSGKYYGTLKSEISRIRNNNQYPLVDIDVQGAISVHKTYPKNSISIFIEAPSLDVLRQRLIQRGTETLQSLEERIEKAKLELKFAPQFNHVIINNDLETAAKDLIQVIEDFLTP